MDQKVESAGRTNRLVAAGALIPLSNQEWDMPQYRFVLKTTDDRPVRTEEYGIFNDQGALQYARRLSRNRSVEIWDQSRLVGRIEPMAVELAEVAEIAL